MAVVFKSLSIKGEVATLTLTAEQENLDASDCPLSLERTNTGDRVVLYPTVQGNQLIYQLELGRGGNLYKVYGGTWLFYFGNEHQIVKVQKLKAREVEAAGYLHKLKKTKDLELALTVKAVWGRHDDTAEKRENLEQKTYAKLRLLPLNRKKVFFESMSKRLFNDNPKAIYEALAARDMGYKLVWGVANGKTDVGPKGIVARYKSFDYWYHLATAKYIVGNHNQFRLRKRRGQVVIQTMHGIPLKHMGLAVAKSEKTIADMKRTFAYWDYFVTPCDYMSDILRGESYNYKGEFLEVGYPRNDVLVNNANNEEMKAKVREKLQVPEGKKMILWAPTWRTKKRFDLKLDLEKMRQELGDECVLVLRSHYLESAFVPKGIYNDFVLDGHGYENANEMLCAADILITDYSSMMFDFSLMHRPMVLFMWDYTKYVEQSRGVYFDPKADYPELSAFTSDEVIEKLRDPEALMPAVDRFSARFNQYDTGHAADGVVDAIWGKKN